MGMPLRVSIVWHGLPAYAARLLRSMPDTEDVMLSVFGTTPPADPQYLESVAGRPLTWINKRSARSHAERARPDICFVSGWAFPECNRFAETARSAGAKIVSMIDNRYRGDARQRLGGHYFRLVLTHRFDMAWVPGESARRLCQAYGLPRSRIATGLYGGDASLFHPGNDAYERPARIGFVGQMIRRKGVDLLIDAFRRIATEYPEYELHLYGSGKLSPRCKNVPRVIHHPFTRPEQIAEALRSFRIFVMPSLDDNWPLALHEAALSGCALLTTDAVGNAVELVAEQNGVVVRSGDEDALVDGLRTLCGWSSDRIHIASQESRRRAEHFGPDRWRREFLAICDTLAGR